MTQLRTPARVVVVGASGSGKTTLARELCAVLAAPHIELDALWHHEGWTNPTVEEFHADVSSALQTDEWVVDGNYSEVRDLVWQQATAVVFIDLPRWVGVARATRRTARRVLTREQLWNGNRERWWTALADWHPIRWSWSTHPLLRQRYMGLLADPAYSHLVTFRLRSRADVRHWLDELRHSSVDEDPLNG